MATLTSATGYQSLTVSTTVVTLTMPTTDPSPAGALVTVETNPIRYTLDGTAPTAGTTGHLVQAGGVIELYGRSDLRKFQAIRAGAGDATLKITYFSGLMG